MRPFLALLFGTVLLRAADPQFPAAAFYWDATHVAIVAGPAWHRPPQNAADEVPQNATKLPDRDGPPYGNVYAVPAVTESDGIKTGDDFDINLTGNFWVRATVSSFIYNKTEYSPSMLALATIDAEDRERYAAAIDAKLHVFLAEPAKPNRVSDTGQIRNPVVKIDLSAAQRATLEDNLNQIMLKKLQEAMLKGQSDTPEELLSPLLGGKANLTVEVEQVDLGPTLGVRQHVLGTWDVGGGPQDVDDKMLFSVQGWKRPDADRIETVEEIDGGVEDDAVIIDAIGDWGEQGREDFTIENVFAGGRLVRDSAAYENGSIYLERMTAKGREFVRSLYGT